MAVRMIASIISLQTYESCPYIFRWNGIWLLWHRSGVWATPGSSCCIPQLPWTIIPASSYNPTWWWKEQKNSWIACERTCPHFPCNWLLQRPINCKYLSICRLIVVPSGTWHCCAYTNWFDLSFLTILIQQKTWYNTHTKKCREGALAQDSLVKLSICHR